MLAHQERMVDHCTRTCKKDGEPWGDSNGLLWRSETNINIPIVHSKFFCSSSTHLRTGRDQILSATYVTRLTWSMVHLHHLQQQAIAGTADEQSWWIPLHRSTLRSTCPHEWRSPSCTFVLRELLLGHQQRGNHLLATLEGVRTVLVFICYGSDSNPGYWLSIWWLGRHRLQDYVAQQEKVTPLICGRRWGVRRT